MSDPGNGYYLNGLRAWKADFQNEHRKLMSRYASLEKQSHPCKHAQGLMIELNKKFIALVDDAIFQAGVRS